MLSPEELLERGRAATRLGHHARARRWLNDCIARAADPELVAQAELPLAYLDAEQGHTQEALRRCAQVIDDDRLPLPLRSLAAAQRALLYVRLGDGASALADFERAQRGLTEPGEVGRLHLNRGNLHLQTGDLDRAAEDFREAVAASDGAVERAMAGFNLAYVDLLRGDLVAALRGMDTHAPLLAEDSPVNAAVAAQDRAEVLMAAGLADEAERVLAEASHIYASHRLGQYRAEADLIRARTWLRRENRRAGELARKAARTFRQRGSESFALRAELVALTAQVQAGRSTPALVEAATALAGELARAGLRQEAIQARLQAVRVLIRRGQLELAAGELRSVRVRPDDRLEIRLLVRELAAELAAARGQGRRSLGHVRAGLAELHDWQSAFGSLDLQSTLVGHGRHLAEQGIRQAWASGSPEELLEWSERARALVSRVAPVRPPADPRLAEQLAELRFLVGGQPDPKSPEGRRVAELRAAIRQRSWYGAGSGAVTEPAHPEELRARLGADDAALVAHVVVDGHLVAVTATDQGVRTVALGPVGDLSTMLEGILADLDALASQLHPAIRDVAAAGLSRHTQDLDRLLWVPVAGLVGDRRVVLTPSGALAGTPWPLLPGLAGRPLTQPRSATHWLQARGLDGPEEPVVGFVTGPNVARADEEVDRSAAHWPADRVRRAGESTAAAMRAVADEVDVLHVAAHGRHVTQTPLFAGVELGDGTFYGYDIDQVNAVPDVVLLSACEVGRGSVRAAEETVGMTAAWLHAGARSVIAAPSLVADDVACEVLARVHEGLAAGVPPADALAAAGEGVLSPFVCFGVGW